MPNQVAPNLIIQTAHSVNELSSATWNKLSAGRPFQSHRWYRFGERVMNDCEPIHLLAYLDEELIGRASLWIIHNEPLPIGPGIGRTIFQWILRRRPLLVCRSPLSNSTGLLLPSEPLRGEVLTALSQAASTVSRQRRCLMLVFDFLSKEESQNWPRNFYPLNVPDPGTVMQNRWESLEEFLTAGNKKDRQHYKRTLREAKKIGIELEKYSSVPDVDSALALITDVDRHYKNAPNPWVRGLLENIQMVNGTWLEVRQHGKMVGGGAVFEDYEAQMTTALGLAKNIPYAYLLLTYASLEEAFKKKVRLLRWGSGAYEVKQKLGFEMEDNAFVVITSNSPLLRKLSQWLAG